MKTFKYIALAVAVVSLTAACQDKLETYKSTTSVYFSFANLDKDAVDSIGLGLVKNNIAIPDSVIEIPVSIMGQKAGHDRAISFEVDKTNASATNAKEGVDFQFMPSVIPADSVNGFVKVKLISSTSLTAAGAKGLNIKLRLVPNENFKVDYTAINDKPATLDTIRNAYKMSGATFKVNYNNAAQTSNLWIPTINTSYSWFIDKFGTFSAKKVAIFIEATGLEWIDWYPTPEYITEKAPLGKWGQYCMAIIGSGDKIRAINKLLAKYEKENGGNPIKDENGNDIKMGPGGVGVI